MNPFPSIPQDLVEYLDELFSHQRMAPTKSDSDRDIWIKVGKRELVDELLQMRKDQVTGADQGFPHVLVHAADAVRAGHSAAGTDAGTSAPAARAAATPSDRQRHFGG